MSFENDQFEEIRRPFKMPLQIHRSKTSVRLGRERYRHLYERSMSALRYHINPSPGWSSTKNTK